LFLPLSPHLPLHIPLSRHLQQASQVSSLCPRTKPEFNHRISHAPHLKELRVSRTARARRVPTRVLIPFHTGYKRLRSNLIPLAGPPEHISRQINHQPGASPPHPLQVVAGDMGTRSLAAYASPAAFPDSFRSICVSRAACDDYFFSDHTLSIYPLPHLLFLLRRRGAL
jgi:hypothetical protein